MINQCLMNIISYASYRQQSIATSSNEVTPPSALKYGFGLQMRVAFKRPDNVSLAMLGDMDSKPSRAQPEQQWPMMTAPISLCGLF